MINKICGFVEKNFAILAILFSIAALIYPHSFTWIKPEISKLLGIIMFGMGITLNFSDFKGVWQHKRLLIAGIVMQYTIMPIIAVVITAVFQLPKEIIIGVIIVGCCPSGTSSNVMAYMGKANLALSVTLTLCTTLLAPLLTPFIIYLCLNHAVNVPFWSMVSSVFWIVLFPLIDGLVIRHFLYKKIHKFILVFPAISILCIVIIIEFAQKETLYPLLRDRENQGLLKEADKPILNNQQIIHLNKSTIALYPIELHNIKSRNIFVKNDKTGRIVKVNIQNAPDLGIWAAKGGNYVCIEPWFGHDDLVKSNGKLKDKAGILSLKPGKTFATGYSIELIKS